MWILHLSLAISTAALAFVPRFSFPLLTIYLFIYFLFNTRKPIFIDEMDEHIDTSARATNLRISAQLKSLFLMVCAPAAGWIADRFGMAAQMSLLSLSLLIIISLLKTNVSTSVNT